MLKTAAVAIRRYRKMRGYDAFLLTGTDEHGQKVERAARTDARVIACGHTHLPEVRDLGWKMIVNSGSAGYVFDGSPTASWALVEIDGEGDAETVGEELTGVLASS